MKLYKKLLSSIIVVFAFLISLSLTGNEYFIDSESGNDNNPGTMNLPWKTVGKVNASEISPGDKVFFRKGQIWSETLHISTQGTPEQPVLFSSYGEGENPKITDAQISIDDDASYITVDGFDISNGSVGIYIASGVSNCIIQNNSIHHTENGGIYTDENIGGSNLISNNEIFLTGGHGIGLAGTCSTGNENIVSGNKIFSNLWHGIEITASYCIIEKNEVFDNGWETGSSSFDENGTDSMIGHSGIHLFARFNSSEPDQGGDNNIIRFNISYRNKDRNDGTGDLTTDGNGIQLDMWCDNNLVYSNITFENDGPGIIAFGASGNKIFNNTMINDCQMSGRRPCQAALIIFSSIDENDPTVTISASDNEIINNIAYAFSPERYALFIDSDAAEQNNLFANNIWYKENSTTPIMFGFNNSVTIADWNTQDFTSEEISSDPVFINLQDYDCHIDESSPAINAGINLYSRGVTEDFESNKRPQTGNFTIGAYEFIQQQPEIALTPESLSVAEDVSEFTMSVTTTEPVTSPLTVYLESDNTNLITVPDYIVIPKGEKIYTFSVKVTDNTIPEPAKNVTIKAFTTLSSETSVITVTDDDTEPPPIPDEYTKAAAGSLLSLTSDELNISPDEGFKFKPKAAISFNTFKGQVSLKLKLLTKIRKNMLQKVNKIYFVIPDKFRLYDKKQYNNSLKQGIRTEDFIKQNINTTPADAALTISSKEIPESTVKKFVQIVFPEIKSVSDLSGNTVSAIKPDDIIVIKGKYFGSKITGVFLEYNKQQTNGISAVKLLKCKIIKPLKYPDAKGKAEKSCMNPETGDSELAVRMPAEFPSYWNYNITHSLVIKSKSALTAVSVMTSPSR